MLKSVGSFVGLLLLIAGGCQNRVQQQSNANLAAPPRLEKLARQELTYRLSWAPEQSIELPQPIILPKAILDTTEYHEWCSVGNVTVQSGRNESGNTVRAEFVGREATSDGKFRALVPGLQEYGPDETLQAKTTYDMSTGRPTHWIQFDPKTGKVRADVRLRSNRTIVTYFDGDDAVRRFVGNPATRVMWAEFKIDQDGRASGVLNAPSRDLLSGMPLENGEADALSEAGIL